MMCSQTILLYRTFLKEVSFKSSLYKQDDLQCIVEKVAEHTNIPIVYSARLGKLVKNRVLKLKSQYKKARSQGGRQMAVLLASEWKFILVCYHLK